MEVAQQLTEIYFTDEPWHKNRLSKEDADLYHAKRIAKGIIHVYKEEDEVRGYYERYLLGDTCFLHNVWVRRDERGGRAFRSLYKHFFSTMPREITRVVGEKHKLGGILRERKIYGKHKN